MTKTETAGVSLPKSGTERRKVRNHSLAALYRKEMTDHITSKRFVIIMILVLATTIASIYGTVTGIADALESDGNFIFLKFYTTSGSSIPSYASFIALIGPFIGLMLGFDAINSERSSGTLNRLIAQPIYRDSVIIGKFLAGAALISIMVISTGVLIGAVSFLKIGILPSGEELVRVAVYLLYTIGVYLLLAFHLHAVFRGVQTFGHFGAGVYRAVDFLRYFYEPSGQHHCQWTLSCGQ